MAFQEDMIKRLTDKGLSESTIKMYLKNLKQLNDDKVIADFKFLNKPDMIEEKIKDYSINTQKSYLSMIVSVLNCYKNDSKKMLILCNKYYLILKTLLDKIKEKPSNTMSITQSTNWIGWDDVMKIWTTYYDKIKVFNKLKTITEKQYNVLLDYIILSLFVKTEPRRNQDYLLMNITNNYNDELDKKLNYYDNVKKQFIFNVYKTSNKYNQQILDTPTELQECINSYIKFHPLLQGLKKDSKYNVKLLVKYDGTHIIQQNAITKILNKIFKKQVSSSMLRHSYITFKFGKTDKDRIETANAMGHSVETSLEYRLDNSKTTNDTSNSKDVEKTISTTKPIINKPKTPKKNKKLIQHSVKILDTPEIIRFD